jgi:hypothetical protein
MLTKTKNVWRIDTMKKSLFENNNLTYPTVRKTDSFILTLNCLSRLITILANMVYYILTSSNNIAKADIPPYFRNAD